MFEEANISSDSSDENNPAPTNNTNDVEKALFEAELCKYFSDPRTSLDHWTVDKINDVTDKLKSQIKKNLNLSLNLRRKYAKDEYLNNFAIFKLDGEVVLIKKRESSSSPIIRIIPSDQYHYVLSEAHTATKHGKSAEMKSYLKYWVPVPIIELFCKLCTKCDKHPKIKNIDDLKGEITKHVIDRGNLEFINMEALPDGKYNWILHYQDFNTGFSILRPLCLISVDEISTELLKIFLQYGSPSILTTTSKKHRGLIMLVINKMKVQLPEVKIILGSCCKGRCSKLFTYIAKMLQQCNNKWSKGIYFLQFERNCVKQPTLRTTPFNAVFKRKARVGLSYPRLKVPLMPDITTEEEMKSSYLNFRKNKYDKGKMKCRMEARIRNQFSILNNGDEIEENLQTQNESAKADEDTCIVLSSDDDDKSIDDDVVMINSDKKQEMEIEVTVEGEEGERSKRIKIAI